MSIALYRFRLFWDGHCGAARSGRVIRTLFESPVLPGCCGTAIEAIDYAPEVHVAQLREAGGPWREMTPAEVGGAEALLAGLERAGESLPFAA